MYVHLQHTRTHSPSSTSIDARIYGAWSLRIHVEDSDTFDDECEREDACMVDAGITGTKDKVGARMRAKAGTRARARAKKKEGGTRASGQYVTTSTVCAAAPNRRLIEGGGRIPRPHPRPHPPPSTGARDVRVRGGSTAVPLTHEEGDLRFFHGQAHPGEGREGGRGGSEACTQWAAPATKKAAFAQSERMRRSQKGKHAVNAQRLSSNVGCPSAHWNEAGSKPQERARVCIIDDEKEVDHSTHAVMGDAGVRGSKVDPQTRGQAQAREGRERYEAVKTRTNAERNGACWWKKVQWVRTK
ncbi:hypothetical protein B0H13DRAFT_2444806 [Mycena leptocephala]|nr:hypothetical protein B0H13DRAFT_2444806 [Mycena leptocephala]